MARVMRHAYTGELVQCAEDIGDQHQHQGVALHAEACDICGNWLTCCSRCRAIVSCCYGCTERHSVDCPWPL